MADRLSLGPVQIHSLDVLQINDALRQLSERLDALKGLRGRAEVFDRLRVEDPAEVKDALNRTATGDEVEVSQLTRDGIRYAGLLSDGALVVSGTQADYGLSGGTSQGSVITEHNRFYRTINFARTTTIRLLGINNADVIVLGGEPAGTPTIIFADAPATPEAKALYLDLWPKAYAKWTTVGATVLTTGANIASLTDNGAGDTTLTFTTPMASADYVAIATGGSADVFAHIAAQAAGSVRVRTRDAAGALTDSDLNQLIVLGKN